MIYTIKLSKKLFKDLLICISIGFFGGGMFVILCCRFLGVLNDLIFHS